MPSGLERVTLGRLIVKAFQTATEEQKKKVRGLLHRIPEGDSELTVQTQLRICEILGIAIPSGSQGGT